MLRDRVGIQSNDIKHLRARVAELEAERAAAKEAVEAWKIKNAVGLKALFGTASPGQSLEASDAFNRAMQRLSDTLNP